MNPYDDFKINSMHIPKDTILQVFLIYTIWKKIFNFFKHIKLSSYVNARLEEYFPEPLEFKPERFLSENASSDGFNFYYFISIL